jgi:hypothetical protein
MSNSSDHPEDPDQFPPSDAVRLDGEERRASERGAIEPAGADDVGSWELGEDIGGGSPSNTHPQSSQVLLPIPLPGRPGAFVAGGLDWFEVALTVRWDNYCLYEICEQLKANKELCQKLGIADQYIT